MGIAMMNLQKSFRGKNFSGFAVFIC